MKIKVHANKDKSFTEKDVYKGVSKLKCGSWLKVLSSCSGMIALIMCFIILAVYCPKANVNMDYLSAIVAILSLVVAVFVAAQIYQSFNLKKDIDEQNKKLLEDMENANKQQIEELVKENEELRSQFQNIKGELEELKADTTFSNVFNYARRMDIAQCTTYAIDGYIDALNVAIKDKLRKDRVAISINAIDRIINIAQNNKNKVYILSNTRNIYYDIIMSICPQSETTRSIGIYLHEEAIEVSEKFPIGELRITSDYHSDNKA